MRWSPIERVGRRSWPSLLWSRDAAQPVGKGGGGAVDGKWLVAYGESEDSLGVDPATLKLVEVLGQVGGLLVAFADVLDDALLPELDGFAVAGVDRPREVTVVARLVVVVRDRAGHGAIVDADPAGRSPDGEVGAEIGGEYVVVLMNPLGKRDVGARTDLGGEGGDATGAADEVGTPGRMLGQVGVNTGEPGEWAGGSFLEVEVQLRRGEGESVGVPADGLVKLSLGRRGD